MKAALPVLFLAIASYSQAQQLEPGQKILSGYLSFGNVKDDPNFSSAQKRTEISVNPSFAWVKNKNTILGLSFSFGYSGAKYAANQPNYGELKMGNYSGGVGVFAQKLKWLNDKWFLYAEGGLQGIVGNHKTVDRTDGSKVSKSNYWTTSVYITPGISYRLTQHFLLDLRLNNIANASFYKSTAKQATLPINNYITSESFSFYSGLNNNLLSNIGIGFRLLL